MISVTAACGDHLVCPARTSLPVACVQPFAAPLSQLMFHGDRARLGWNAQERDLSPDRVASQLGWIWDSPPLDSVIVDGHSRPPHLYASPLYADAVPIGAAGTPRSVVFAATSNGFVYAIHAFQPCGDASAPAPGTIAWSAQLGQPSMVPTLDGGIPLGILGTPVIDLAAETLYVVSQDASAGWQAYALDVRTGAVRAGWPVTIDDASIAPVNTNGPAKFQPAVAMSQRGALALSLTGDRLYVPFGAYADKGVGFLVAIDTRQPALVTAFSSAPSPNPVANGGMWAAGGPAIDAQGRVWETTGNGPPEETSLPAHWSQSLLRWTRDLALDGSYTPFNFCPLELADIDLGGSSPLLLPDLDPATTATPRLVAFGGKQGNVYLVDRDALPNPSQRHGCSMDPTSDQSLLPPEAQPQFGARGPLNVFGPYSETVGMTDRAKMRSTAAYFTDGTTPFLFVSGSTKRTVDSTEDVPPSLVRLRVVATPGQPAWLAVDAAEPTLAFINPGSPVVSSDGANGAVVWVLDENAPRSASLADANAAHPVLYAVDGTSMTALWRSAPCDLDVGGKYSTPVIAHGVVFVGTDRIQAFGLR